MTPAHIFAAAFVVALLGGWIGCGVLRAEIRMVTRQRDLARHQRDQARGALQRDLSAPLAKVLEFPERGA